MDPKPDKPAYIEPNIPKKFLAPYDPAATEPTIYDIELKSGFFNPDESIKAGLISEDAKPYSMVLPPPNVTGVLHLGHSLIVTLQDTLSRFERMRGKKVLWIPGTDHAAIATQSKVEKEISKKEGKSRYDLGREEMLNRINAYATQSHDTIISQVKRLGASCDWTREAFTLDEARNKAVRTIFKQMFDDGLIYRGHRIVNWDPKGQTTIADDEIVYVERPATLYTFKYSKEFPISISTTRPETKIGDVAVAVHPDDERYAQYVGKEYQAVFCGAKLNIKIVADSAAEKEFGTGAVGVTPAHSMIDFEIAERHNLPLIQVIDEKARMMVFQDSPLYDPEKKIGMKASEAREIVAEWIRQNGLMEKEEAIVQRVSTAERTDGIVEPLPKTQWFVAVNKTFKLRHSKLASIPAGSETTLKEIMKKTVADNQVTLIPDYFNKTYFHWIDNLRDWCISRQIWYGHRIPVWYKKDEAGNTLETYCDINPPQDVNNGEWTQDEDTLDTWFSSGLWTFSTLGWPDAYDNALSMAKTGTDLARFHPTKVLVTAYEILFFWVARMILMTGYAIGDIPFEKVYITGIVRDSQGRKMSKSLGNGGDPIEMSNKYGADALRMYYATATTPGTDSRSLEDKIKGYKHFANKIWNIARFILSAASTAGEADSPIAYDEAFSRWSLADVELMKERDEVFGAITRELEEYKVHLAAEKIYHYAWSTLADVILESSKPIFKDGTSAEKESRAQFLLHTLRTMIKVLHPFMPHLTEEVWSLITTEKSLVERANSADAKAFDAAFDPRDLLMVQTWPL